MRRLKACLILVCFVAAVLPLLRPAASARAAVHDSAQAWPAEYDGKPLTQLPLTEDELRYFAEGPIRMGRFSDGRREILFRQIDRGTRRLHSSAYCLRGVGFELGQAKLTEDAQGRRWSQFTAQRGSGTDRVALRVSERIEDRHGQAWTDVSAWYWAVLLEQTQGPWLAVMIREPQTSYARLSR